MFATLGPIWALGTIRPILDKKLKSILG